MMGRLMRKLRTWQIFRKSMLNYGVRVWLLQYRLCTSTHMFSDIIHISDTSPTKGDVAHVKALNGTVLRKVTDDPEWQKICEEGERRHEEAAAIRLKKGPSHKRPHMEVTSSRNDQDDFGEPLPDPPVHAQDKLLPLPEHQATNFDNAASHGESHCSPGPSVPTP